MKFDEKRRNSPISTHETRFQLKYFVYVDQYRIISIILEEIGSKYRNDIRKPPISWIILSRMNEVR